MTAQVAAPPSATGLAALPAISGVRRAARHPGWPLTAMLLLYPLWWALGLGTLIVFILVVPMTVHLVRNRPVSVPAGFGLWVCYLLCAAASTALLAINPPGTVPQSVSHRILPLIFEWAGYLSVTVVLLYAGNLTEEEFPRRRLVRQLGFLFCVVVAGGLLGVVAPTFQFTSPVERLLPSSIASNIFVQSLVHPAASQLQDVLGYVAPRPAAPFGYTNTWGDCLALLVGWFVISWLGRSASLLRRVAAGIVLAVTIVPVVYSLNRGLWVGLGLAALFVVARLALRGNLVVAAASLVALIVAALVFSLTPFTGVIQERLAHGHSNDIRTFTVERTVETAGYSPVLGFGAPRAVLGSSNSIAVGKTASCPRCGQASLGSTGQLWAILISHGYLGTLFYVGFFLRVMWVYRRDRTSTGDAGLLALFLSLWFMFVYNALVMPLVFTFLSVALLWRNQRDGVQGARVSAIPRLPLSLGMSRVAPRQTS